MCHPAAVFSCAISPITDKSKMTVLYLKHHMCVVKDWAGRVLIIIYILKKRVIAIDELENYVVILFHINRLQLDAG